MNNFWSKKVQSTEILHFSRTQRINEDTKHLWLEPLNIKPNFKILEVGCGSGHFTNTIKRTFPDCEVVGIDLDEGHIKFAKEISQGVTYLCADINDLPFEDDYFDIVFSHTVIEHLPFKNFITEQKRVLKPNGKIFIYEVEPKQKHIHTFDYLKDEINEILDKIDVPEIEKPNVGIYSNQPYEVLTKLDNEGFCDCKLEFKEIMYYFPDNAPSKQSAIEQIESARLAEMYEYLFVISLSTNGEQFEQQLLDLNKRRYDERIKLFDQNKKIYDYETTFLRVMSGTKKASK